MSRLAPPIFATWAKHTHLVEESAIAKVLTPDLRIFEQFKSIKTNSDFHLIYTFHTYPYFSNDLSRQSFNGCFAAFQDAVEWTETLLAISHSSFQIMLK